MKRLSGKFLSVGIAIRWKRSRKYFGANLLDRYQKNIKLKMSLFANVAQDKAKKKLGRIFCEFIDDYCHFERLVDKMRTFYEQIIYIQKHVKNGVATRYSKIDVLQNYWEKVMINLQLQATQLNDKKGN